MKLAIGTVTSNADITRSGSFSVSLGKYDGKLGEVKPVKVRYVTPYGSADAGWISIPTVGSTVLVGWVDVAMEGGQVMEDLGGYFYLGSIYGGMSSSKQLVDVLESQSESEVQGPESTRIMPPEFDEVYEAKGIVPEKLGLVSVHGDAFTINNRVRVASDAGASDGLKAEAFNDHRIEMRSGTGKKIKCVDTPTIDAIIITNNAYETDQLVWTNKTSDGNNHGNNSVWWTTKNRIDIKTYKGNMKLEVLDGKNLEIINSSTGSLTTGVITNADYGPEDTGCITLHSKHNNIIVKADEKDAVIRVHAPGDNAKVIVTTGGTVDIEADKDITITSGTKVQINAPLVDINGATEVDIDGGVINLN